MTITVYEVGDVVRLNGTFTNVAGTLADPSGLVLRVLPPNGTLESSTLGTGTAIVDGTGTGYFYSDYTIAQIGRHYYWWVASGAVATVEGGEFEVSPRPT